jgi:hypothetical protein
MDVRTRAEDHTRSQRAIDRPGVHVEHQCVAADCHYHIPSILP